LKFSIKNKKPLPNIAPVQVSDKNLHPFMYSIFYSIGREREGERENSTKPGVCVCWSWSVLGEGSKRGEKACERKDGENGRYNIGGRVK